MEQDSRRVAKQFVCKTAPNGSLQCVGKSVGFQATQQNLNPQKSSIVSSCAKSHKTHKMKIKNVQVTNLSDFPCEPTQNDPDSHTIPNTELEPSIAVGPNPQGGSSPMVVIVNQVDRYTTAGGSSANGMKISLDGGQSFGPTIFLPNVKCFGGFYDRSTNSHVTIRNDGKILFVGLPFNNVAGYESGISVGLYNVLTASFEYVDDIHPTTGTLEGPSNAGTDFPSLVLDPQDPSGNTAYISWEDYWFGDVPTYAQFQGNVQFSKTTDGINWSTSVIAAEVPPSLSSAFLGDADAGLVYTTLLNNPGKLYSKIIQVFTIDTAQSGSSGVQATSPAYSCYSIDQGLTWTAPIPISSQFVMIVPIVVDPDNFDRTMRTGPLYPPASDRQRNLIYVVAQENSIVLTGVPSQICLYVSKDGANSWIRLGQINRVPSVQACMPYVAVLDDGCIAVSYYDFRNHQPGPDTLPLETDRWLNIFRFDGDSDSLTFLRETRLTSSSFDFRKAPALAPAQIISPPGLFTGDYHEMATYNGKLYHSYTIVPPIATDAGGSANIQLSIIDFCD
jgi:hypothetical protein